MPTRKAQVFDGPEFSVLSLRKCCFCERYYGGREGITITP